MKKGAIPPSADIAIIGGGLVGASLALLLAQQRLGRVLLLEARPWPTEAAGHAGFDARATALSESTRQIFAALGVWDALEKYSAPITRIQVSDRGHPGATRMTAEEENLPALGYVLENQHLGQVLMDRLTRESAVTLVAPAKATAVKPQQNAMLLATEAGQCAAQLVVVADGAGSATLQKLGVGVTRKSYGQTALIANVELAQPHQGIAYERFTEQGPLALLPLPTIDRQQRMALVWTLPDRQAQTMLSASEGEFLKHLHQRFGYRAGIFTRAGARASYPLQLVCAREQMRRNLVVVGNAAHSLHPVAGQGFNLALRDIARLVEVLAAGRREHASPGDPALLQRWLTHQQADQQRTILLSDLLPGVFSQSNPLVVMGRNLGLLALDLLPGLRSGFARFGTGLTNTQARLNHGLEG